MTNGSDQIQRGREVMSGRYVKLNKAIKKKINVIITTFFNRIKSVEVGDAK